MTIAWLGAKLLQKRQADRVRRAGRKLERPQRILGLALVPVTWRSPPVRCRHVHDCAVTQAGKLGSGSPTGRQPLKLC